MSSSAEEEAAAVPGIGNGRERETLGVVAEGVTVADEVVVRGIVDDGSSVTGEAVVEVRSKMAMTEW